MGLFSRKKSSEHVPGDGLEKGEGLQRRNSDVHMSGVREALWVARGGFNGDEGMEEEDEYDGTEEAEIYEERSCASDLDEVDSPDAVQKLSGPYLDVPVMTSVRTDLWQYTLLC